jgi:DNA-binding CsgD family transcriptional regulator
MEWLAHAAAMVGEAGGDARGALDLLQFSIDIALERGAPAVVMNLSTDAARLARAFGDEALLDKIVENLVRLTAKTGSPVVHGFHKWTVGWQRCDHAAIERAAEAAKACGRRAEHIRAHHDAAVVAASVGNAHEARRHAQIAFAGYEHLRAPQLHARLRAELRTHGLSMRPRRSPPRPTTGWDALTDTERRVVRLVGDGLSNGTIAEQLFVSRRTVESHLARVYQKLGFPRRAELVLAARDNRLLRAVDDLDRPSLAG